MFEQGTKLFILDPALLDAFPDSQSVKDALHAFLSLPASQHEAASRQPPQPAENLQNLRYSLRLPQEHGNHRELLISSIRVN